MMEVERIEQVIKDTITKMMPDCIYTAEHVIDKTQMDFIKENRDAEYIKQMIEHSMCGAIAALLVNKPLKIKVNHKPEDPYNIHFQAKVIVMTENEVKTMITIAANHIKAIEDGRER